MRDGAIDERVFLVIRDWVNAQVAPSQALLAAWEIARRLRELPVSVPSEMVHEIDRTAVSVAIPAIKRLRRAGLVQATPDGITVPGLTTEGVATSR